MSSVPLAPTSASPFPAGLGRPATNFPRFSALPTEIRHIIWNESMDPPALDIERPRPGTTGDVVPRAVPQVRIKRRSEEECWALGVKSVLIYTRARPPISRVCQESRHLCLAKMKEYLSKWGRPKRGTRRWEIELNVPSLPWSIYINEDTPVPPIAPELYPTIILEMSRFNTFRRSYLIPIYIYFSEFESYKLTIAPQPCIRLGISHDARLTSKACAGWLEREERYINMMEVGVFRDLARLYDPEVHGPGGLPYPIGEIIAGPEQRAQVIERAMSPIREH